MKRTRAEAVCGHWGVIGRHSAPCIRVPGHNGPHGCACGQEWPQDWCRAADTAAEGLIATTAEHRVCCLPAGHDGPHRNQTGDEWPQGFTAFCCQCARRTRAPIQVRYIERPSGPGVAVYACPECAPHLSPGPSPDELQPPTQTL